jgi:hypothetical protein
MRYKGWMRRGEGEEAMREGLLVLSAFSFSCDSAGEGIRNRVTQQRCESRIVFVMQFQ